MTDLVALTCRIARGLEGEGVDYAIGGAIALGFHAPPRGTHDIDLNLFVEADEARPALTVLADLGVELDLDSALSQCRERGDARGRLEGVRVDIFVNSVPLHPLAHARRKRVRLAGTPLWVLSAEDLVVLKLLFYRGKDIEDCRRVLALQGSAFDLAYAREQLVDHVGEDDPRTVTLDEIAADHS
jgi:hypothetical protein